MSKILKKDFDVEISKNGNTVILKFKGVTILHLNMKNLRGIDFEVSDNKHISFVKKADTFFKLYKKICRCYELKFNCVVNKSVLRSKPLPATRNKILKIIKNLSEVEYDTEDREFYKDFILTCNKLYQKGHNSFYNGKDEKGFISLELLGRDGALTAYINNDGVKEKEKVSSKEQELDDLIDKYFYKVTLSKKEINKVVRLSKKIYGKVVDDVKVLIKDK